VFAASPAFSSFLSAFAMSLLLSRLAARTPLVRRAAVAQLAAAAAPLRAVSLAQLHSVSFVAAAAPAAPSATAAAAASSVNPVKLTTNITGLDAIPNAREVLMGLLKETLASIESYNAALGFEPAYNLGVRQLSQHRLKICEQNESHEAIEKAIWFGQIEELIQQAEDELDLLVTMNGQTTHTRTHN
jgi:NADH dehydrogenase (ubiquinone) 1 alpha subcomplex subunit 5